MQTMTYICAEMTYIFGLTYIFELNYFFLYGTSCKASMQFRAIVLELCIKGDRMKVSDDSINVRFYIC